MSSQIAVPEAAGVEAILAEEFVGAPTTTVDGDKGIVASSTRGRGIYAPHGSGAASLADGVGVPG